MSYLTGNIRHRLSSKKLFRGVSLVLQVEEMVESVDVCPMTCDSRTFRHKHWRDATVFDLQELCQSIDDSLKGTIV